MTHAWMRTANGRYIDLLRMKPEDVDLEDIMVSLHNIKRFNGHYQLAEPLTVLQHSMLVSDLTLQYTGNRTLALAALLHDAHEAYVGDISSPVKTVIGFHDPVQVFNAVYTALGIKHEHIEEIKTWDLAALEIERKAMWPMEEGDEQFWPPAVTHMSERSCRELHSLYLREGYIAFTRKYYDLGGKY